MKDLTALVIGATGATGKELVKLLLADENVTKVKIFVRKETDLTHPKLETFVVDFDKIETWKADLQGDILFSALGTTLKQAESEAAQHKVDFDYQYNTAKAAAENGVKTYALVSSTGANPQAFFFYPRMKGELEEAVKLLNFQWIHIFQPGILDRQTDDNRPMESLGLTAINALNSIGLFKSQKPMPVKTLAEKMIKVSKSEPKEKVNIYALDEIFSL